MVTLTGFNFVRKSVVYFKGKPAPFRAVSATELQVTLDAEALREAGRFDLVVKNPEPLDPFYVKEHVGQRNVEHRAPDRELQILAAGGFRDSVNFLLYVSRSGKFKLTQWRPSRRALAMEHSQEWLCHGKCERPQVSRQTAAGDLSYKLPRVSP